jgi:hypothetical protein
MAVEGSAGIAGRTGIDRLTYGAFSKSENQPRSGIGN